MPIPLPQSCIEALLIESGLSVPYAFPNEPYSFLYDMAPRLEICYAYSGGRGVPFQKFDFLATAGGRTVTSFADRLLAHTQQASAHTPKNQKNNDKRCADWDYNQSHALSLS